MSTLCTAFLIQTRFVFQPERYAMRPLCLTGTITLLNHIKNFVKPICCSVVTINLVQELFMSSWKSPEQGLNSQKQVLNNERVLRAEILASTLASGNTKCFEKS